VGPRALLRDLTQTARVMARFGPKLPGLVEAALIRQSAPPRPEPRRCGLRPLWAGLGGAALFAAGMWAGTRI
jgi:ubiquinone biosynthesis protein